MSVGFQASALSIMAAVLAVRFTSFNVHSDRTREMSSGNSDLLTGADRESEFTLRLRRCQALSAIFERRRHLVDSGRDTASTVAVGCRDHRRDESLILRRHSKGHLEPIDLCFANVFDRGENNGTEIRSYF